MTAFSPRVRFMPIASCSPSRASKFESTANTLVRRCSAERFDENPDKAFHGLPFFRHIRVDPHAAVGDLDVQKHRRHALDDSLLAGLFARLVLRRQRRQPGGEIEQQVEPFARI